VVVKKAVKKAVVVRKTVQKVTTEKSKKVAVASKAIAAKSSTTIAAKTTDQNLVKTEVGKMNDCCQFCNNRLVLDAVKRGSVQEVKKLLSDYDNITNPY
jgi:hypothetical protein